MIVEDNALQFSLMRALLEPEGYTLTRAESGDLALQMARETMPDLILLDIFLPGMSGFDVVQELKSDPRTRRIPVAMLSATASREDLERAAAFGCQEFFTKPINTRTFAADLATLIARCR